MSESDNPEPSRIDGRMFSFPNDDSDADDDTRYVYAIGHPHNFVKIGKSKHPDKRLRQHQISCPYELWLIVQFPASDAAEVEEAIHDELSDKTVRGEWFKLTYSEFDMLIDIMKMSLSNQDFESVEDYKAYRKQVEQRVMR